MLSDINDQKCYVSNSSPIGYLTWTVLPTHPSIKNGESLSICLSSYSAKTFIMLHLFVFVCLFYVLFFAIDSKVSPSLYRVFNTRVIIEMLTASSCCSHFVTNDIVLLSWGLNQLSCNFNDAIQFSNCRKKIWPLLSPCHEKTTSSRNLNFLCVTFVVCTEVSCCQTLMQRFSWNVGAQIKVTGNMKPDGELMYCVVGCVRVCVHQKKTKT